MANRFVRYDYLHDYDISNLKFAIIGGSALNRETQDIIKKYLSNTMIIQAYGELKKKLLKNINIMNNLHIQTRISKMLIFQYTNYYNIIFQAWQN